MEFCPKCGNLLLPEKKGRKVRLVCRKCNYWRELEKKTEYTISEKGKEATDIMIIEEEKKRKKRLPELEYEIDLDYYEEFYE